MIADILDVLRRLHPPDEPEATDDRSRIRHRNWRRAVFYSGLLSVCAFVFFYVKYATASEVHRAIDNKVQQAIAPLIAKQTEFDIRYRADRFEQDFARIKSDLFALNRDIQKFRETDERVPDLYTQQLNALIDEQRRLELRYRAFLDRHPDAIRDP